MSGVKFSELPLQPAITANTIIPTVSANTNYVVTVTSLQSYFGSVSGNITADTITANTINTGTLSASGNITGAYLLGNGSQLTGITVNYSNANVAAYLPTFSGNLSAGNASVVGNVTGTYFIGNGSLLTGISGGNSTYGNANVVALLSAYGNNISSNSFRIKITRNQEKNNSM